MKAILCWARALLFSFVGLLSAVLPAQAQIECGERTAVLQALSAKYGEAAIWQGRTSDGHDLLITANPDGGTWTVLRLDAAGQACLLVGGPSWQPGSPLPLGEEG